MAATPFEFPLATYLARVGLPDDGTLRGDNLETLRRVADAQAHAIPFENLTVVVGQTVSIQPSDVAAKILGPERSSASRRGGYCFEVNTLLRLALEALGFTKITRTLCRVLYRKPPGVIPPHTHIVLQVTIDGRRYMVDVGFGGSCPTEPLLMPEGESEVTEQSTAHGVFRLAPFAGGVNCTMALEKLSSSGDERFIYYVFDPAKECVPADEELVNWGCCTMPGARFTTQFFVHHFVGPSGFDFVRSRLLMTIWAAGVAGWGGGVHSCHLRKCMNVQEVPVCVICPGRGWWCKWLGRAFRQRDELDAALTKLAPPPRPRPASPLPWLTPDDTHTHTGAQ
jgi:N-hydroxyarylamine O-acetyltransferase